MIMTDPAIISSFPFRTGCQIARLKATMGWDLHALATALGMRTGNVHDVLGGREDLPAHALSNLELLRKNLPQGTMEMLQVAPSGASEIFGNNDGLAFLFWFINNPDLPLSARQAFMDKLDKLAEGAEHAIRGTTPDGATE